jgi:uracil-DNA glycosylase
MVWEKFKDNFHESWHAKMQPFIESEECDKIYEFLKSESKRGKKIAPLSSDVWRCFKETPLTDLKVVMIGMCPYHTERNGEPVADGLLMGCSKTGKLQPSLEQFYGGIERELYDGLHLTYDKTPDVSYLAKQGVLMMNAALTTEINKAGSHIALWEPFIKYFFEYILQYEDAPVVFLGKDASKYKYLLAPFKWSFVVTHPASAAYKNTDWSTEGTFAKVNKILKDSNNFTISWLDEPAPF